MLIFSDCPQYAFSVILSLQHCGHYLQNFPAVSRYTRKVADLEQRIVLQATQTRNKNTLIRRTRALIESFAGVLGRELTEFP